MRCANCSHDNLRGTAACASCGGALFDAASCAACGTSLTPGQRFCGACGQPVVSHTLDGPSIQAPPASLARQLRAARGTDSGEHKQVTVLFVDVKGSMDLAETVDSEQWYEIVDKFYGLLCESVHKYEGLAHTFTGDGIMGVFGAPLAYEDHARRAALAALHVREQVEQYAVALAASQGIELSIRIGLHSGEVIVAAIGDDLTVEYAAIGRTAGIAQRMEGLAEPGSIYLSESTAKLLEGYFELEARGERAVKGSSVPLTVYQLIGPGKLHTPLEVARERGFSRFVGRGDELDRLTSALSLAAQGNAQVAAISGEPGVGKSRLQHEFTETCQRKGLDVFTASALAHTSAAPFALILELLRSFFGIKDVASDERSRAMIAERVTALRAELTTDLPLIVEFLGLASGVSTPQVGPEALQRQVAAALNRLLAASSERGASVIVLEDLHWIDAASEPFLKTIVAGLTGTRTLLLLTFRPEYNPAWMQERGYVGIELRSLDRTAADVLLAGLVGTDQSIDGLADLVRDRAAGNPFFIEEIVTALAERGDLEGQPGDYRLLKTIESLDVPSSIESVLAARIDRLPRDEKRLLQIASVIGRKFSKPELIRVSGLDQDHLRDTLEHLERAQLIYAEPDTAGSYAFKHALTAEVAYRSQLTRQRERVHRSIADAIVDIYPESLDELSALIARHRERSGDLLEAARWTVRAATWAGARDPFEAARRWRHVQRLTDRLEVSDEQTMLALAARTQRVSFACRLGAPADQATDQFEQEIGDVYQEGRELAANAGLVPFQALLTTMYATFCAVGGHDSRSLGEEADSLASSSGDPAIELAGIIAGVYGLYLSGDYEAMIRRCDRGIALGDGNPTLGGGPGFVSPLAWTTMWRAVAYGFVGRLDDAHAGIGLALELARQTGDNEVECWSQVLRGSVLADLACDDPSAALNQARAGSELAERSGGAYVRLTCYWSLGVAQLLYGAHADATLTLEKSLAIARQNRVGIELEPATYGYLARAHLGAGDPVTAVETARRAVGLAVERGTAGWEILARLALAESLIGAGKRSSGKRAEAELTRAAELIRTSGASGLAPRLQRVLLPAGGSVHGEIAPVGTPGARNQDAPSAPQPAARD
jgi:class 3 adenylate cyclase